VGPAASFMWAVAGRKPYAAMTLGQRSTGQTSTLKGGDAESTGSLTLNVRNDPFPGSDGRTSAIAPPGRPGAWLNTL